jgi:hypothetical protein
VKLLTRLEARKLHAVMIEYMAEIDHRASPIRKINTVRSERFFEFDGHRVGG